MGGICFAAIFNRLSGVDWRAGTYIIYEVLEAKEVPNTPEIET